MGWRPCRRLRVTILSLAVLVAASAPGVADEQPDLAYGPDPEQVMDLHVPPGAAAPVPVVVFFHGGAFVGGDKHPCAPNLVALLAERGVAFACANYRLAPRVHYPVPMRDGARAVQWLRAHAAEFGLDPARVAVMGMSAGAGIAMWVAFRPDLADPASSDPVLRQSTAVSAVVAANAQATYDPAAIESRFRTTRLPKFLAQFYGAGSTQALTEARFRPAEREASPIDNMHAGEPPLLAYYGKAAGSLPPDALPQDYIHHPAQGAVLAEVARQRGAEMTLRSVADYRRGWADFLGEAAEFLGSALRH